MRLRLYSSIAFTIVLQSCMPAASNSGGGTQPQPITQEPGQSSNQTATSSLSEIGASSMLVTQGTNKVSLSNIAAQSTAALTVFEFVGVTCSSCQTEAPYVASALAKYGSKVTRVMAFPNAVADYSTSEYLTFTNNYASKAPYVIDDTMTVIKKVRSSNSQYFGVFIIVDKAGKGQILNQEPGAYMSVDSAVQKALGQ